jgi:hypothetical protein
MLYVAPVKKHGVAQLGDTSAFVATCEGEPFTSVFACRCVPYRDTPGDEQGKTGHVLRLLSGR